MCVRVRVCVCVCVILSAERRVTLLLRKLCAYICLHSACVRVCAWERVYVYISFVCTCARAFSHIGERI